MVLANTLLLTKVVTITCLLDLRYHFVFLRFKKNLNVPFVSDGRTLCFHLLPIRKPSFFESQQAHRFAKTYLDRSRGGNQTMY